MEKYYEFDKDLFMVFFFLLETILKVGSMSFIQVDDFKYLGINISSNNKIRGEKKKEQQMEINVTLLSKITLYTSYLRPIVIYASETWSQAKENNKKLAIQEKEILRNMHGSV